MQLLGPPLITSPRAVKRLTNSYGVLTALHRPGPEGRRTDLTPVPDGPHQAYPYRAAMVLLAAVIGFPDLGPVAFPALYRQARATPNQPWTQWLTGLRCPPATAGGPQPTTRHTLWHPLDGNPSSARAERWNRLVDALHHVTEQATAAGLPLPCALSVWQPWVIPVGRLSFPTGPAVTGLADQE